MFTSYVGLAIFVPQDLILIITDLVPYDQRQNPVIINLIIGYFSSSFLFFFLHLISLTLNLRFLKYGYSLVKSVISILLATARTVFKSPYSTSYNNLQ